MTDDKRSDYAARQLLASMLHPPEPTGGLFKRYSRRRPEPETEPEAEERRGNVVPREGHTPAAPPTDPMRTFLRNILGADE